MEAKDSDLRESFIRQRRNLMIMCLVIIVQESAGLTYSTLSFLGNTATVDYPFMVKTVVYVMWIYWAIRYFQLFMDVDDPSRSARFQAILQNRIFKSRWFNQNFDNDNGSYPQKTIFSVLEKGYFTYWIVALLNEDKDEDDPFDELFPTELMQVPLPTLFWSTIKTAFIYAFTTRYFTEYYLPFCLFVLSLGLAFSANYLF